MTVYGSVYGSVARALKPAGPAPKHGTERRPLLRLVPSARPGRPLAPYVVLMLGLLVAGLMGLLLLNTWTAQDAFRLHALQAQQSELDDTEQALRQQVDDATDPGVLAQRAAALGMVPGDPRPQFVHPNGTVIGGDGSTVTGTKQGNLLIVAGPVPPPPAPVNATPSAEVSASTAPTAKTSTAPAAKTSTAPAAKTSTAPAAKTSTAPPTHTRSTHPGTTTHTTHATNPKAGAHPTQKPTRP